MSFNDEKVSCFNKFQNAFTHVQNHFNFNIFDQVEALQKNISVHAQLKFFSWRYKFREPRRLEIYVMHRIILEQIAKTNMRACEMNDDFFFFVCNYLRALSKERNFAFIFDLK